MPELDWREDESDSEPPSTFSPISLIPIGLFVCSVVVCGGMLPIQDKSMVWKGVLLMWALNGLAILVGVALLVTRTSPRLLVILGMVLAVLMGLFADFAGWRQ